MLGTDAVRGPFDEALSGARLLYREDDGNFKRRINTAIQMTVVFNTAITIILVLLFFLALDMDLLMGLLMGILLAFISNFHLTLSRVTVATRWEVYKNRVVMPIGLRGRQRTIDFEDIEVIEREVGITGETVNVRLRSGEAITLDVGEQRKPLEALDLAFRQFDRSRRGPASGITIPVREDGKA